MRKNLMNARKNANFTKGNIAKFLGITDRQYQRIEAGTSKGSVDVWEKLSLMLDETINFLLEQEEPLNHDTTRKVM